MQEFAKLLEELNKASVRYVVVGGISVVLNGYVRATEDVDILVDTAPENLSRLLACLAHFGEGSARELTPADFTLEEGCIRVVEDFPLDIFTLMRGADYAHFQQAGQIHLHPQSRVPYLSIEGLRFLKGQSTREKDQWDIRALNEIAARSPQ